jgi:iron-sulfur cluster insertion protein
MDDPQVSLSPAAARHINTIMAKHNKNALRVAVVGGGCSGFSYTFDFADKAQEDDLVIKRDGATVLVDSVSLDFLVGSQIDYSDELIGAAFKINNPNAKSGCGCGTSFSL